MPGRVVPSRTERLTHGAFDRLSARGRSGPAYTAGVLDIAVLGPLIVRRDDRRITIPGATQRALLTLLVLHRPGPVSADRLVEGLWVETRPRNPRNALQQAIVKLRTALHHADDPVIVTDGAAYRLDAASVRLDVERFATLVDHAQEDLAGGNLAAAQRRFQEALALWRDRPFTDLPDTLQAESELTRLHELRLGAIEGRIEADLGLGRADAVVVELGPLLEAHPLRERLWRHLMVALYRAGRQADALEAYRRARTTLVEQVGVEPGEDLQRVHDLILARDPSLLPRRRPAAGVVAGPVYDLLEAVRDAAGALSAAGRDSDHAQLVLAFVRALNREPAAYVHQRWLSEFDAAHDSIAAAISWAIAHGRPDTACALVVEVAHYWDHRQLIDTARATLSLVAAADPSPSSKRSEALTWLAFFASEQGDVDDAMAYLETAVADANAAGDPAREAGAGAIASVVLRDLDPTAAERRASAAVDLFLAHGDRREIAYGWTTHALAALAAGAPQAAAGSARAAAAIYAELGDRRGLAWTRATQSRIAATLGLDADAAALRDEARTVALHIEDTRTARHLEPA